MVRTLHLGQIMRVRAIKFAALLFANAAALALSSALPVQSLPQWVTIEGLDSNNLLYNFNSLKSLPNDVKQVDVYYSKQNREISCIFLALSGDTLLRDTRCGGLFPQVT